MAEEANPASERAAWTIKSVPVEIRKLATACALKNDENMAEWLARAVRNQANLEAGERVLPPAPAAPSAAGPVPVVDIGELAELMRAAQSVAESAGVPIPKTAARHAVALMTTQLRAARGLPSLPARQSSPKNGQTIDVAQAGSMVRLAGVSLRPDAARAIAADLITASLAAMPDPGE